MSKPLFICLCAVWNHRQEWTENLIQSFIDQDYDGEAELYLLDDRPGAVPGSQYVKGPGTGRDVHHYNYKERFPFLMAKYDQGIVEANLEGLLDPIYVCVMDDDDIYLPHFLSDHAAVLHNHSWSYPSKVYSSYGGRFQVEDSGGRFWASSAYRLMSLQEIGGYGDCVLPFFDQQFLARMRAKYGETVPGPERPGYVYNWDMTLDDHTSGYMGSQDDSWYKNTPHTAQQGPLVPKYCDKAQRVLEMYRVFTGGK